MINYGISQHLYGGQGQVGGPQVPLLGHGDKIESPNWVLRGTIGHEMVNYEVSQHLYGDQGQVSGPQVPLLGHGDEIERPSWVCTDYRT